MRSFCFRFRSWRALGPRPLPPISFLEGGRFLSLRALGARLWAIGPLLFSPWYCRRRVLGGMGFFLRWPRGFFCRWSVGRAGAFGF